MEQQLILNVNGKDYTLTVPIHWSLARTLREKLGLTGTKISCEQGDCGACTVIIDGKAVHSCIVPVAGSQGRKILTIEGLSQGSDLHFVQRAFMKAGAIQCGFCTPGMVMAIVALYMQNENPSDDDVKKAIAGNLCRCTGYKKIIQVTKEIDKERKGVKEELKGKQVHVNHIRKDSFAKVTGKALYVNDYKKENMLYGVVLRSSVPFGKIVSIDTQKAKELPGVEAVLTAADLKAERYGGDIQDQEVLVSEIVKYVGEPIAVVAAIDMETAESALRMIDVRIEPYAPSFEATDAMKKDAEVIHADYDNYKKTSFKLPENEDSPNNVCFRSLVQIGDVEEAFKKADIIVEEDIASHRTHPGYLEAHGALSFMDENNKLNIISSIQKPFFVRAMVSQAFGIPQSEIIVKAPTVGGGFGGKTAIVPEPLCAALTLHTGKPVKMICSREEDMIAAVTRHKLLFNFKTGVMNDGTIVARRIKIIADAGAYTIDSHGDINLAIYSACGPYRYENLEVDGYNIYTNTVPAGSNRAPCGLPAVFAVETHTDSIAKKINMDPLEFRLKNIVRNGDKTFNGQTIKNCCLEECLKKVAECIEWEKGNIVDGAGKGLSLMWWCSGDFPGSAIVGINDDSSVQIISGFNEIGTGSKVTAIPQIAAEALGVEFDNVSVSNSDTNCVTYDHGVGASRMTHSMGKAVLMCVDEIKKKMADFLLEQKLTADRELALEKGMVLIPSKGTSYPLGQIAKMYKSKYGPLVGQASINIEFPDFDESRLEGFVYPAFPAPSFVAQGAVVRKDEKTGLVTVEKMVSVQDAGFAVNPMAIEGQMEGGLVMGLSYALMEEMVFKDGVVQNTNFHDYKIPTAMDVPEIETHILECAEVPDSGPMGAKGVAENALAPAAGAIANAVFAITGARENDTRINLIR